MYSYLGNSRLRFSSIFLLVGLIGISLGYANEDLEEGMKSKAQVDEMKQKEVELREETNKKITQMRELALKHLETAREKYLSQKKQSEADVIAKEINQLRSKMGMPPLAEQEVSVEKDQVQAVNDKEIMHFKYNTSYLFNEEGLISGEFIFMPNQKVKIQYKYKGKDENVTVDWKDMGDHVQVEANSLMGQILISTKPDSNQKSLFVRWGGEMTNKISDANAK
jgi:hypothetical protein